MIIDIVTAIMLVVIAYLIFRIARELRSIAEHFKKLSDLFAVETSQEIKTQVKKIPVIKPSYFKDSELKR